MENIENVKIQISKWIVENNFEEALKLLSSFIVSTSCKKDVVLLRSRINNLKSKIIQRTINHEQESLEKNMIGSAIMDLVQKIDAEIKIDSIEHHNGSSQEDHKIEIKDSGFTVIGGNVNIDSKNSSGRDMKIE